MESKARKPRFIAFIFFMALLMALALVPSFAAAECTVHGLVYDWSTFSTVDNAVVQVYSLPDMTPLDKLVARDGSYSFSLPGGDYMIVASAGAPGTLSEIVATENVTRVPDIGERVIDLILFPADDPDDLAGFTDVNVTPTLSPESAPTMMPDPTGQSSPENWDLWLGGGAILLAVVAIIVGILALRMLRPKNAGNMLPGKGSSSKVANVSPSPVMPDEAQKPDILPPQPVQQDSASQSPTVRDLLLPEDCRQVLAIIEKNDGRITQLDLRKMLPYSEAKVSLIVSDLESRGLVKKIKKGRGNVLILNRPEDRGPET
jgi:Uncharacterized membrane-associated protein/domain